MGCVYHANLCADGVDCIWASMMLEITLKGRELSKRYGYDAANPACWAKRMNESYELTTLGFWPPILCMFALFLSLSKMLAH